MKKFKNKKVIIVSSIILFISLLVGIFAIYVSDYYHADTISIKKYIEDSEINKRELYDGVTIYEAENSKIGFIFYPGGKVESSAYEPLMYNLANNGVTSILVEMPFNLAVFNINAASKILKKCPEINTWYIGGHSLGGSMAASYISKNADKFKGLILLGSYSTSDLSDSGIKVLSIFGSEDKVLNKEKYEKNKTNLPEDYFEIIIEGGCHAFFGMYGMQDGDGNPSIKVEEQINITSEHILEFIKK